MGCKLINYDASLAYHFVFSEFRSIATTSLLRAELSAMLRNAFQTGYPILFPCSTGIVMEFGQRA